ncbi:hypothetical protein MRB53_017730 [Persea americana]|uniref:Uncharacterized protein n=1 Tax=Persea americana TaxID=3435 RepID=A0ACC2M5G1_PERAE|nr:hypothetical protein MRB53_017730 [Persea americana]
MLSLSRDRLSLATVSSAIVSLRRRCHSLETVSLLRSSHSGDAVSLPRSSIVPQSTIPPTQLSLSSVTTLQAC